ncbi:tryptophan synthase subunit alpha [Streptomyces avermitilis]|uniref:tryptophan synthase subunit alpha n=1 Tax=Streptomyces avermitilis TaxID=33903 RepID=UPI0033AE420E
MSAWREEAMTPRSATRLDYALEVSRAQKRAALGLYLPVGYPTRAAGLDALHLMAQSADVLELGIPHHTPHLDGPVIRRAVAQALDEGFRMPDLFTAIQDVTAASTAAALVMSYWQPVADYGTNRFSDALAAAGASGVLIPDLPASESERWLAAARSVGLHTVNLVDPHADTHHLARTCATGTGMVYAPATHGLTGGQGSICPQLSQNIGRLRAVTGLPVGVGIGISTPDQAARLSAIADAVVIGSPVLRRMYQATHPADAAAEVAQEFADAVRHPINPVA